jgi:SAM-dependent methyltransferase
VNAPRGLDATLELNYRRWLPQDKQAPILDLGCGNGRVLRYLSALGYSQVKGVDRDPDELAEAKGLPGVTVECAEVGLDYLRAHRGKFKLIILKQMIYYIDRRDVQAFMQAVRDALTDDGMVLVEFFNASLLSSRFTELKDPFIRTGYTEHAMRRLLAAAGLFNGFMGGEVAAPGRPIVSITYRCLRRVWVAMLRAVYILERGMDDELPRIYTKSIIAVAGRQVGSATR